jgi:LysM repeat protein
MTERGLQTEGAPACPFVAFEDDRDGRSTAPDHRHRCFAEPRPATRALAHQEAYCLSSAFPVCPTFQDWARREAAAARPAAPAAAPSPVLEETPPPQSRPMPPLERDSRHLPPSDIPSVPPRRSQQREWASPPPWAGAAEGRGVDAGVTGAAGLAAGAAGAGIGAAGAGIGAAGAGIGPAASDRVHELDERDEDPSRGLAGSAAYRLAGPDPDEPLPARPEGHDRYLPPERRGFGSAEPGRVDDDLDDDAWAAGDATGGSYVAGSATARTSAGASRYEPPTRRGANPSRRDDAGREDARRRDVEASRDDRRTREAKRKEADAQELFGPAWERPRRYEAYPKLATRVGLPNLGRVPAIALWGGGLLVAALILFMFGPTLLGLNKGGGGAGAASHTAGASVTPTATPEPTEKPAPTAQIYRVAKNDTMSKIAKKFGLTLEQLLDANPEIKKNPNKIKIGDPVTIPVPVEDGGAAATDGTVSGESQAP